LIAWAKGKTVLNLDIKDAPAPLRLDAVRHQDAFRTVLFTVHSAEEARFFYEADHRSLLACVLFNLDQMKSYEAAAGIPGRTLQSLMLDRRASRRISRCTTRCTGGA